jgi:diguanylate cyclase (GGDEF)-like protein
MLAKDSFLGVINFSRKEVGSFSDQEIRMLSVVAGQVAISLENARLYAKTKELSLIDDLTRAYNRRHFHKILDMEFKRAKRFNRSLSLLMIDVDHFKHFNDSLGHLEGDRLLVKLAATLNASLREVDTVARYGGEEFAVILPNTSLQDAEKVGNKLRKAVEEIHVLRPKGSRKKVTVSIGISSLFSDASSLDDLINHADIALYKAKSQGRNLVIAYESIGLASLRVVE